MCNHEQSLSAAVANVRDGFGLQGAEPEPKPSFDIQC